MVESTPPLIIAHPKQVPGSQDDIQDQFYEIVELREYAEVECGVVYEADDGTSYYYEEVVEEVVEDVQPDSDRYEDEEGLLDRDHLFSEGEEELSAFEEAYTFNPAPHR